MTTKKLVFECKKCGYDNNVSIELEGLDDLVLSHKNKKPYPRRQKYLDSDEVNLTN